MVRPQSPPSARFVEDFMTDADLAATVDAAWEGRAGISPSTRGPWRDAVEIPGGPVDPERGAAKWWDKVPSKFAGWSSNRFRDAGFRAVPGSIVRRSAFIAPGVVLMPSFVNVGAYVGSGTM